MNSDPGDEPAEPGARDDEPVRMTEAEAHFATRLGEDLERVLGAGIGIADLQITGDGPVHVRAALLVEGAIEEVDATGDTSLEAYRALVKAAAELRLAKAFWRMVTDV